MVRERSEITKNFTTRHGFLHRLAPGCDGIPSLDAFAEGGEVIRLPQGLSAPRQPVILQGAPKPISDS